MNEQIKLLDCPFCGQKAERRSKRQFVHCSQLLCPANGKGVSVERWNDRHATRREDALVEALEHYADTSKWRIASDSSDGYKDWYQPEGVHGFDVAVEALAAYKGDKSDATDSGQDGNE